MIVIEDLSTRPDLRVPALGLGGVGGEFLQHDQTGLLAKSSHLAARWPEYFLVLLEDGVPVARAAAVPVAFPTAERPELPDHGWDAALIWAAEDLMDDRETNTLIALEVMVAPGRRGGGLATKALEALKKRASETAKHTLVVPVRPAGKETEPGLSFEDYIARRRPDGLPEGPWLRTHERLGARFVKVAPFAMTVTGTFAQWRTWTGVELQDGLTVVPGGIAPVLASASLDVGVYVEPNVWLEHLVVRASTC
ncbi:GNAT family N-acetyltransferase [Amycolatopsis pittospori]|uniref:GNAT family N-acetyltransferase n=1 Tax=Amycolatopsis pittospori TaxID=2749434 RepID=UPI0015F0F436|nr:GNAT family N-acetyltransferase [Amycolatopsis pittospori]